MTAPELARESVRREQGGTGVFCARTVCERHPQRHGHEAQCAGKRRFEQHGRDQLLETSRTFITRDDAATSPRRRKSCTSRRAALGGWKLLRHSREPSRSCTGIRRRRREEDRPIRATYRDDGGGGTPNSSSTSQTQLMVVLAIHLEGGNDRRLKRCRTDGLRRGGRHRTFKTCPAIGRE